MIIALQLITLICPCDLVCVYDYFKGACGVTVIVVGARVQILNEFISTNILGKVMNQTILPPSMGR